MIDLTYCSVDFRVIFCLGQNFLVGSSELFIAFSLNFTYFLTKILIEYIVSYKIIVKMMKILDKKNRRTLEK